MPACVVGVLRSAMRPPSSNASAPASGGAESAPAAATLNVAGAGDDAAVGFDPTTCRAPSCGPLSCEIQGASPCSIGFAAAGEDAATASVGFDPTTCRAPSCGPLSCGIQGASPCSIGFAAAGEDAATASVGLDPPTCRALPCGPLSCGIQGASLCSIGFAAAGEGAATASVGLDPSTCRALSCGAFSCGAKGGSLRWIGSSAIALTNDVGCGFTDNILVCGKRGALTAGPSDTGVSAAVDTAWNSDALVARCSAFGSHASTNTCDGSADRCGNTSVAPAARKRSVPQDNHSRLWWPGDQCQFPT